MKTLLLIAAQFAASGTDAYLTDRAAHRPNFQEHDAMARPFVANGRSLRIAYFSVDAAVKIGVSELLRRKHPKLGAGLALAGIADNTHGVVFTALNSHP